MVRALASHQCVPGSIPGPGVICGLSLLLVLYSAPRGFSPGTPVFPSHQKTNTSKFQFDLETVDEEPPRGNATANPIIIIIIIIMFRKTVLKLLTNWFEFLELLQQVFLFHKQNDFYP